VSTGELRVTRAPGDLIWRALDGDTVAGEVRAWRRPDGRHALFFDAWRFDTYRPLADAVANDLRRDLFATLDDSEFDALDACARAGFTEHRRESCYKIPSDPALTGLGDAALPPGVSVISAGEADIDRLRLLDDDLRQDVPGTDGWRWDPAGFKEETYRHRFDPETYLVAVAPDGQYAGLVRVWNNRVPRLGLVAVRAPYRRRGIARALLGRALGVLHERGAAGAIRETRYVVADADDENEPSVTLLSSLGARRTGGSVELIRRYPH
jgi:GNAT superfamily N-acetyltransferase